MAKKPLESIAQAQRIAKRRLPKDLYVALLAGAEQGVTREWNATAFDSIGILPRLADLSPVRDQSTTFLGMPVKAPIVISPTAGYGVVHPGRELAVARAANEAGIAAGLANSASTPMEEFLEVADHGFFQMYWVGNRDDNLNRVQRAKLAGSNALFVTLDYHLTGQRDWGSPAIPQRIGPKEMVKYAPAVLPHLPWLFAFLKERQMPTLSAPNLARIGEPAPTLASMMTGIRSRTTPVTWKDLAALREEWGEAPFVVKGITHPDDARRAVDIGATAVSVSNHGGNNIDSTPATIRLLPGIVDAVGSQVDVLFDGGIRRGGDIVKALALGAKAGLIGRGYLWPLAAGGQQGVLDIINILKRGIDQHLLALGLSSIHELNPDHLIVPKDFFIRVHGEPLPIEAK